MENQVRNLIAKWDATWPSPLVVSRQHDNGQFRINLVDYPEPENYEDQNEEILETINYYLVVWMKQSEDGEMEKLAPIQLPGPYWLVNSPYTQLVQDIKFQFYATSSVTGYIAHSAQFKGMILESLSGSQQQSVIPEEMWDAYKQYIEDKIIGAGLATIDPTLSISGAAADAKAAGDAIAGVNGRLAQHTTSIEEITDAIGLTVAELNAFDYTVVSYSSGAKVNYLAIVNVPLTNCTIKDLTLVMNVAKGLNCMVYVVKSDMTVVKTVSGVITGIAALEHTVSIDYVIPDNDTYYVGVYITETRAVTVGPLTPDVQIKYYEFDSSTGTVGSLYEENRQKLRAKLTIERAGQSRIDTLENNVEPVVQNFENNKIKSITPLDFEMGGIDSNTKWYVDRNIRTDRARLIYIYRGVTSVTAYSTQSITTYIKKYASDGSPIGVVSKTASESGATVDTSGAAYVCVSCVTNSLEALSAASYRLEFTRDESYAQSGFSELKKEIADNNIVGPDVYTLGSVNQIARLGWNPLLAGYPPQQSIPSYRMAYDNGVRMMLCDVRVTADGKYVCWHDSDLSSAQILNSDGTALSDNDKVQTIASLTLAELDQYDFGLYKGSQYAGTKILRLEDFLAWCAAMNIFAVLEIKVLLTPAQIAEVSGIIKSHKMHRRTVIADYYTNFRVISTGETEKNYTFWITNLSKALYIVLSAQANWSESLQIGTAFSQAGCRTFLGHITPAELTAEMISAAHAQDLEFFYTEIKNDTQMSEFYNAGYLTIYTLINSGAIRVLEWIQTNV